MSLPVRNDGIEKWLETHPTRRTITVRQSSLVSSPLTYGVIHPVILLPKTTVWNNEETLHYGQEYDREYFYTGICDLSYINIEDPEEQRKRISQSMPLFGWYYDIPFEEIKKISMAGINIGPWGKDFHKLTERVLMENLYDRTPHILDHAITILLG